MTGETPPGGRLGTNGARYLDVAAMELSTITRARRRLVQQVAGWGWTDTDEFALVCSELITNAVLHAGGAFRIRLTDLGQRVRVEVDDRGPGQPLVANDPTRPGGLGLHIVAELSERWGSEKTPTGKRVWAEVRAKPDESPYTPLPAAPPPPGAARPR